MSNQNIDKNFGSKLGMWLFLLTEILLFGGMFLLYAVYLSKNRADFHKASQNLSTIVGAVNTVILLTSSLTVVLSIYYLKESTKKTAKIFLGITIFFAFLFLVNKYFEWGAKFDLGIYPNSPVLLKKNPGEILFYGLYFVMTGLHAVHIFIGIVLLSIMYYLIEKGIVNKENFIKLENSGLYWHLVDIIWIFLFPLFYLVA